MARKDQTKLPAGAQKVTPTTARVKKAGPVDTFKEAQYRYYDVRTGREIPPERALRRIAKQDLRNIEEKRYRYWVDGLVDAVEQDKRLQLQAARHLAATGQTADVEVGKNGVLYRRDAEGRKHRLGRRERDDLRAAGIEHVRRGARDTVRAVFAKTRRREPVPPGAGLGPSKLSLFEKWLVVLAEERLGLRLSAARMTKLKSRES